MLLDGIDNNINEHTDSGKAGYGGKLFSFWQRVNNSDHLSRSWYWAEGYCICLDCNWMNSIQGGSGPIKKPASAGFNVIGSRDSVAYPFLSPHRLVGVLLRLLTSCFCWCCPCTVQSWLAGVLVIGGVGDWVCWGFWFFARRGRRKKSGDEVDMEGILISDWFLSWLLGAGFCVLVEALVDVICLSFVSRSERFCRIIHSL